MSRKRVKPIHAADQTLLIAKSEVLTSALTGHATDWRSLVDNPGLTSEFRQVLEALEWAYRLGADKA